MLVSSVRPATALLRGSRELLAEPGEDKRSERQPEISQRDVKVPGDQQESPDEAKEPRGHNVRSQVRLFGGSAHLTPEAESAECAATQVVQPRTLGLAIQNETAGFQNERIGLDGCTIAE